MLPKRSTHGCRFAAGYSRNSQDCSEADVRFMTAMATKMPYIGPRLRSSIRDIVWCCVSTAPGPFPVRASSVGFRAEKQPPLPIK
jgi:hypothetical protein